MESEKKRFWLIASALFVMSTVYDVLVIRRLARQHQMEKWTWLTVVVGVGYTVAGFWLLDRRAATQILLLFCASGAPMSVGDLVRWWERERNGRKRLARVKALHVHGDV